MPRFTFTQDAEFDAEQWPGCGLEVLTALVGTDRIIVADDDTPYVINTEGHPTRVWDGWWVRKDPDGSLIVASETVRQRDWKIPEQ